MHFLIKQIPIDEFLTPEKLAAFSNYKGRYHAIADLASKSTEQKTLFLDRVRDLYQKNLAYSYSKQNHLWGQSQCNYTLNLFLVTVFCNAFPLYDFVGIELFDSSHKIQSHYGVMYSTYTHDLDRELIEKKGYFEEARIEVSVKLTRSLFTPTSYNESHPPLADRYPVFIFPQEPQAIGKPSATNLYMKKLGFQVSIQEDLKGKPIRCFSHHRDSHTLNDIEIMAAIRAVGQVLVEMTRPDLYNEGMVIDTEGKYKYLPRSKVEQFNRENFTVAVKKKQTKLIKEWLHQNAHQLLRKTSKVI